VSADIVIADVRSRLAGEPVFLAGSLVAEQAYGKTDAHSDVDIFCPTLNVTIAMTQKLLCQGFTLDDKFSRVWQRWLKFGTKGFHTNSMRMHDPGGVEWNLIYKLADGHPTTSLSQVLESFDFGLLGMGWDLESDRYMDLRPFLFEDLFPQFGKADAFVPLPLMPNKRSAWRNGFISQYNGLREFGRYAKYHERGYDMSLVKDDLVTGYWAASLYFSTAFEEEKQKQGQIYEVIARHIESDNIDELLKATKLIDYKDSLDMIMEALE
jgi:hypothetical protein